MADDGSGSRSSLVTWKRGCPERLRPARAPLNGFSAKNGMAEKATKTGRGKSGPSRRTTDQMSSTELELAGTWKTERLRARWIGVFPSQVLDPPGFQVWNAVSSRRTSQGQG